MCILLLRYSHIINGYIGSKSFLIKLGEVVKKLKKVEFVLVISWQKLWIFMWRWTQALYTCVTQWWATLALAFTFQSEFTSIQTFAKSEEDIKCFIPQGVAPCVSGHNSAPGWRGHTQSVWGRITHRCSIRGKHQTTLWSGKTITNEEEALAVMEILHQKGVSTVILSRWVKERNPTNI